MSEFVQCFSRTFSTLNASNPHRLDSLYSEEQCFCDPLHGINGLSALQEYFAELHDGGANSIDNGS